MLSFKKSGKMINDIFNPSKFIYSPTELATLDRLTPDAREAREKEEKQERLLQLLSLYFSNDLDRQIHLHDRQQQALIRDSDRLQYSSKPATSEESQG